MTLHRARILSSENDSSCKQEQNTNVNIKIKPPSYPNVPPPQNYPQVRNINFTQPGENVQSPSQPQTNLLTNELENLEMKNKFLETLLNIYELNPLRVNNYLVCHSNSLMELIKILDEEEGCTGCLSNTKYMNIQRILVTKDDKTLDLKIGFNEIYSQLVRYGISTKMCI